MIAELPLETAHKLDITMFEAKEKRADNAAVQALAAKMLPTLRDHLEEAKTLDSLVPVMRARGSKATRSG